MLLLLFSGITDDNNGSSRDDLRGSDGVVGMIDKGSLLFANKDIRYLGGRCSFSDIV